jgi:hypothetical protein
MALRTTFLRLFVEDTDGKYLTHAWIIFYQNHDRGFQGDAIRLPVTKVQGQRGGLRAL